ncbi:hypothetical protein OE88DRAFT_287088 [Heliocybe sulcata]|uniref:F-box domain-containing protein n=1 Tax=Heliocybe sulcata TaxID=5364 RepID=A0A5C3N2P8_9AGAM|nr:hypothetical protein OE88DRAFT_287088 [Heliocybe sulcata]
MCQSFPSVIRHCYGSFSLVGGRPHCQPRTDRPRATHSIQTIISPCAFYIWIRWHFENDREVIDLIHREFHRIHSLHLNGQDLAAFSQLQPKAAPELRFLELHGFYDRQTQQSFLPNLSHSALDEVEVRHYSLSLFRELLLPSVTSLTLKDCTDAPVPILLALLKNMPLLRVLSLKHSSPRFQGRLAWNPEWAVTLSHLQDLELHDNDRRCAVILAHISCPSLRTFHLQASQPHDENAEATVLP